MSTAPSSSTPLTSRPTGPSTEAGPTGWATFAGVVLLINGCFAVMFGLAAILNDDVVTVGGGTGVTIWDFTAWGWITLVIGVFMILTSAGLFAAAGWARWTAVGFAMLNALAQFGTISAFPLWSLLVVALDITIIYQLVARWDAPRGW
jgi:hypothetical protein